jgi:hypothetical protein
VEFPLRGRRSQRRRACHWLGSAQVGWYVLQPQGYLAFLPGRLPPSPPVKLRQPTLDACLEAEKAISDFHVPSQQPNHERGEKGGFEFSETASNRRARAEIANYTRALDYGVSRLDGAPPSMALLLDVHRVLVAGLPRERLPGEIRRTQNWVGGLYCPFGAAYIPPPPHYLRQGLHNLDEFLSTKEGIPPCVQAAMALAQLQLIHPFCNGNGRMGRILAILTLVHRGLARAALLPFEAYLRPRRGNYLRRIALLPCTGDWESWIGFITAALRGCALECRGN